MSCISSNSDRCDSRTCGAASETLVQSLLLGPSRLCCGESCWYSAYGRPCVRRKRRLKLLHARLKPIQAELYPAYQSAYQSNSIPNQTRSNMATAYTMSMAYKKRKVGEYGYSLRWNRRRSFLLWKRISLETVDRTPIALHNPARFLVKSYRELAIQVGSRFQG